MSRAAINTNIVCLKSFLSKTIDEFQLNFSNFLGKQNQFLGGGGRTQPSKLYADKPLARM